MLSAVHRPRQTATPPPADMLCPWLHLAHRHRSHPRQERPQRDGLRRGQQDGCGRRLPSSHRTNKSYIVSLRFLSATSKARQPSPCRPSQSTSTPTSHHGCQAAHPYRRCSTRWRHPGRHRVAGSCYI